MKHREWMLQFCRPNHERFERPFPVKIGGIDYDAATDGFALLLVAPSTWPTLDNAVDVASIKPWLEEELPFMKPRALLEWAFGAGAWCPMCSGRGAFLVGDDEEMSIESHICGTCHGDGIEAEQPGTMLGHVLNRRLLYRKLSAAVAHLGNYQKIGLTPARKGDGAQGILVQGDGWKLILMGMSSDSPERGPELYDPEAR